MFVSSTFYDLKHVRADLRTFIEDSLAYTPLLSEHPSFPIDPDAKAVESCKAAVARADVFVLLVGGRYGSVPPSENRSVTNLEYLAAVAEGIPTFAFIDKGVWELLPLWRKNPSGDWSGHVDTPKLFEFVEELTADGRWFDLFESPRDVCVALSSRLATLMLEGLTLRRQLKDLPLSAALRNQLGPGAMRIALERKPGWEYLLFRQTITEEIEKHRGARINHDAVVAIGLGLDVPSEYTLPWLSARLDELRRICESMALIVNDRAMPAVGAPGQPGNINGIVRLAVDVGNGYSTLLEWAKRVRLSHLYDAKFNRAREELSRIIDIQFVNFDHWIGKMQEMEHAIERALTGERVDLDLTLVFNVDVKAFNAELRRLTKER